MSLPPLVAVVDDDAAIREALSDLLQALGLDCRAYPQAEAFLEDWRPERFGVLLTDIRMPGMGGIELLRRVRALDPAMPVVVITSVTEPEIHRRVLELGARASLTKPVLGDDLLRHLEELDRRGPPSRG